MRGASAVTALAWAYRAQAHDTMRGTSYAETKWTAGVPALDAAAWLVAALDSAPHWLEPTHSLSGALQFKRSLWPCHG